METGLQIAIVVNIVGISIAVWFLRSRLKAKLAEVEERQARKKRELDPGVDVDHMVDQNNSTPCNVCIFTGFLHHIAHPTEHEETLQSV